MCGRNHRYCCSGFWVLETLTLMFPKRETSTTLLPSKQTHLQTLMLVSVNPKSSLDSAGHSWGLSSNYKNIWKRGWWHQPQEERTQARWGNSSYRRKLLEHNTRPQRHLETWVERVNQINSMSLNWLSWNEQISHGENNPHDHSRCNMNIDRDWWWCGEQNLRTNEKEVAASPESFVD